VIDWYIKSREMLRELQKKSIDALRHCEDDETAAAKTVAEYMKTDYKNLRDHWHSMFPEETFGYLGRHIKFGEKNDFNDIIKIDIPDVELKLDQHLVEFKKNLYQTIKCNRTFLKRELQSFLTLTARSFPLQNLYDCRVRSTSLITMIPTCRSEFWCAP